MTKQEFSDFLQVCQGTEEGEMKMDLGDMVVIDHPGHPFNGCVGKIVGRRGNRTPDDVWMLVYIAAKMRDYLVPQSMLRLEKNDPSCPSPLQS